MNADPGRQKRLGNPSKRPLRALPLPVSVAPAAPDYPNDDDMVLSQIERRTWTATWAAAPWLDARLDAETVRMFSQACAERVDYVRAIREHGAIVKEPITSSRGELVGVRMCANPAEAMLRRVESRIESCVQALGLTPGARARLGLQAMQLTSQAEQLMAPRTRRGPAA